MNQSIKILQITDLHLFASPSKSLLNINPYDNFQKVLKSIQKQSASAPPDLTIFSGDISQDYSPESYEIVKKCLPIFKNKVAFIPGNHDSPKLLNEILNTTQKMEFNFPGWRILLLDSFWQDHVAGYLSESQLTFLKNALVTNTQTPTLIFIHHHVLPIHSHWLDKIGLTNADKFLNIITKHKNIKAVIYGHIHQENYQQYQGIDFISTPATCWQFLPQSDKFKLDTCMPGYRWINLHSDGTFDTQLVRLDFDPDIYPDLESKGY